MTRIYCHTKIVLTILKEPYVVLKPNISASSTISLDYLSRVIKYGRLEATNHTAGAVRKPKVRITIKSHDSS